MQRLCLLFIGEANIVDVLTGVTVVGVDALMGVVGVISVLLGGVGEFALIVIGVHLGEVGMVVVDVLLGCICVVSILLLVFGWLGCNVFVGVVGCLLLLVAILAYVWGLLIGVLFGLFGVGMEGCMYGCTRTTMLFVCFMTSGSLNDNTHLIVPVNMPQRVSPSME